MKSSSEVLRKQLHALARSKVRGCSQPGTVLSLIEDEMQMFLTQVLNQKLQEEQDAVLARPRYQRGAAGRYRNGYKAVRLSGLLRALRLRRPVLRRGTPRSPTLRLLRRVGNSMLSLLASRFWLRGTSTRAVAQELNGVFGTKLSACDVSRFSQELLPQLEGWLQRPIEQPIAYLYLDALYLPVRKPGFTTKQALLCAIGIATDGTKHVLAFMLGDRENLASWTSLLDELLKRGLDRSTLRLVISDEHKAIVGAVEQRLGVAHQLCLVHKMRNALVRVAAKHRKAFYADFKATFWATDKDQALRALGRLEASWTNIYPKATAIAISNPTAFLRFMDQPQKLWTILRSSNFIERFNRELRRRLRSAGAMHSEDELWKLVASISIEQEKRWLKRKAHAVTVKELNAAA